MRSRKLFSSLAGSDFDVGILKTGLTWCLDHLFLYRSPEELVRRQRS